MLQVEKIDTNIDKAEFAVVAVSRTNGIAFIIDYEGFYIDLDCQPAFQNRWGMYA